MQGGTSATLHTDDVKKYVRNLVITAFSTTEQAHSYSKNLHWNSKLQLM